MRPATPYARMTGAPTTLSATAASIAPMRWRTRPYAPARRRWNARITMTAGTNAAITTSVSCHE